MNNLTVIKKDGQLLTDSREVAELIGKRHDNLVRDIKGYADILTTSNLRALDFFISDDYEDAKGETRPCYLLTKQGCEMVANKMTGQKGVLFTAKYVQAFNHMEKVIQSNFSISEFKGQLTTFVTDLFKEKLEEVEKYYKINASTKCDLVSYIKNRLGINRANEEYELVKERVFLLTGITKLEDISFKEYKDILPVIDESIRIIKMDRPSQASFFD